MPQPQHHSSSDAQRAIEELKDLYEQAPCGYLSLGPGGRIERTNGTFLAWTGHNSEELLGRRFQDLLNIAGKIYYETHFAPLLRIQGFFNEVALDLVAKNGNVIPVLVNAVEERDIDEKPTVIRVTVFNATDRRRYERELLTARNALAAANLELRAFYDTLPVGIFRADTSGKVAEANQRFYALLGIVAPDDWLTAIAGDERSEAVRQLKAVLQRGEPFSRRFQVADGKGVFRHIDMKAVPIPGVEGDDSTVVGVVEDVTEQVHAEFRRRQIERQLAISQLTGGLAHNLNNILTIVMGNLEMLEDTLADRPEDRAILDRSLVATERAAGLVNRLLICSGYSMSQPDLLAIDSCLQQIAEELAARVGPLHQLTSDLRAPGTTVELNSIMLKGAIHELVANAAAAMPAGGEIRLSTRLSERDASGDQCRVIVAVVDDGIGMDEATQAMAREPFFTMRQVGQGIGLGLSFVDGVSRIGGGELKLQSHTGAGTTVEMHLPSVIHKEPA